MGPGEHRCGGDGGNALLTHTQDASISTIKNVGRKKKFRVGKSCFADLAGHARAIKTLLCPHASQRTAAGRAKRLSIATGGGGTCTTMAWEIGRAHV